MFIKIKKYIIATSIFLVLWISCDSHNSSFALSPQSLIITPLKIYNLLFRLNYNQWYCIYEAHFGKNPTYEGDFYFETYNFLYKLKQIIADMEKFYGYQSSLELKDLALKSSFANIIKTYQEAIASQNSKQAYEMLMELFYKTIDLMTNQKEYKELLVENSSGTDYLANTRVYSKYWTEHIRQSQQMIRQGIERISPEKRDSALVLGVGTGLEIPINDLLENFKTITLVDINKTALTEIVKKIRDQRKDIHIVYIDSFGQRRIFQDNPNATHVLQVVHMDISGGCLPDFIKKAESIKDPMALSLYMIMYKPKIPDWFIKEFRSSYVIASCVGSQIYASYFERLLCSLPPEIFRSDSWYFDPESFLQNTFSAFMNLLENLVEDGGIIYWSDSVCVKGFQKPFEPSASFVKFMQKKFNNNFIVRLTIGEVTAQKLKDPYVRKLFKTLKVTYFEDPDFLPCVEEKLKLSQQSPDLKNIAQPLPKDYKDIIEETGLKTLEKDEWIWVEFPEEVPLNLAPGAWGMEALLLQKSS